MGDVGNLECRCGIKMVNVDLIAIENHNKRCKWATHPKIKKLQNKNKIKAAFSTIRRLRKENRRLKQLLEKKVKITENSKPFSVN